MSIGIRLLAAPGTFYTVCTKNVIKVLEWVYKIGAPSSVIQRPSEEGRRIIRLLSVRRFTLA